MKNIKYILVLAITFSFLTLNSQEKKIQFNKGTLKICSSKNFTISGYDGNEVIIKSLHEFRDIKFAVTKNKPNSKIFSFNGFAKNAETKEKMKMAQLNNKIINGNINNKKVDSSKNKWVIDESSFTSVTSKDSSIIKDWVFLTNDVNRSKGLKKLGKNNENSDLGIYFTIEQKDGELIFKDDIKSQLLMSDESYEIKIPNSIKLNWQSNICNNDESNKKQYHFFSSKISKLSDFNGEVEISSTLNNMKLIDVTGPVSINTIGGNLTIEFDKKTPQKLYSVYSNNGFIDITLPTNSDLNIDAIANEIFSDIDFIVEEEKEDNNFDYMKLKLKSGKVKMKLNAGLGNIYLRKK